MVIPFTKAHGTGNDFIILFSKDVPLLKITASFIKNLCNRHTGVGADGLLLISQYEGFDFKIDYYNNDGSWETMCANGARCAVLFMYKRGLIKKHCLFLAGDGPHKSEVIDELNVKIKMSPPRFCDKPVNICGFKGRHVDSGAQHFVVPVDSFSKINAFSLGKKIRYSKHFSPKGINVNFFKKIGSNSIQVLTYEKGVERIMMSCGSGSVASAFYASILTEISSGVIIQVSGGSLSLDFDSGWKNVWLSGAAILLFNSSLLIEDLQ